MLLELPGLLVIVFAVSSRRAKFKVIFRIENHFSLSDTQKAAELLVLETGQVLEVDLYHMLSRESNKSISSRAKRSTLVWQGKRILGRTGWHFRGELWPPPYPECEDHYQCFPCSLILQRTLNMIFIQFSGSFGNKKPTYWVLLALKTFR